MISATIIAQDEERAIVPCIESVSGFCEEILVVDGGSKDRTREVASKITGVRILERPFDDFARQHEFARSEARGEWVFSIDADERASPELAQFTPGSHAAYSLPFKNHFRGVWLRHGGFWPDRHVRLFRRAACRYDLSRTVHEKLVVDGPIAPLDAPILHFTYESLEDCLAKMTRYGLSAAEMLHGQGRRATALDVAVRPFWRFVRGYVFKAGFLDGAPGAAAAWARAYEAYVKYARLWELSRFS
ncbi:MAG: glycosyltransferase family 2 protein [Myxococcales bacterium]|nr:glycosyltransferase family 2 protein [Myxococcales bacterium]